LPDASAEAAAASLKVTKELFPTDANISRCPWLVARSATIDCGDQKLAGNTPASNDHG
jgi:hypothetical protein